MDENSKELAQQNAPSSTSETQSLVVERKARVDAIWEKMNKGLPAKTPQHFQAKSSSAVKKSPCADKNSHNWMTLLGLRPNKAVINGEGVKEKRPFTVDNGSNEEAKKLAAAAIAAVKDGSALGTLPVSGQVEITEVRDFAGQEIEIKKVVDANSKEAAEKAKHSAGSQSAVDAILEQIKKKQKLSVLDKTKKDWGEYKEENKGVEDELDAYKKSSNQYLDKVSFLQRTDYREFERERDARLAVQAKRA